MEGGGLQVLVNWAGKYDERDFGKGDGGGKECRESKVEDFEAYVPVAALMARRETAVAALIFLIGKIIKPKPKAKAKATKPRQSGSQSSKP